VVIAIATAVYNTSTSTVLLDGSSLAASFFAAHKQEEVLGFCDISFRGLSW